MNEDEKLQKLYKAINEMIAFLGAEGEINIRNHFFDNVMNALFDIDEGVYDDNRFKKFMKNLIANCDSDAIPCYGAWVSVSDELPPYDKKVLVIINDGHRFCAILRNVTRSTAKNAPKDKRWYAFPGLGHELKKVTAWRDLPKAT